MLSQPDSAGLAPKIAVKIGGALLRNPALCREILASLASFAGTTAAPCIIVPGGGLFADQVRHLDQLYGLSQECSHRLAIASMDLNAMLLAECLPNAQVVGDSASLQACLTAGKLAILQCSAWLAQDRSLPASWEVTSDSIALAAAELLNCERLIIVKMRDHAGMPTTDPVRCCPTAISSLVERDPTLLDAYFPKLFSQTSRTVLLCNARQRTAFEAALKGIQGHYTVLTP